VRRVPVVILRIRNSSVTSRDRACMYSCGSSMRAEVALTAEPPGGFYVVR
jgi:hypothetical protein